MGRQATKTGYPRKLYYRIQEVADIVGVEPYVLRYWETRFPMLAPERTTADERRYRQRDVELLRRIRRLLHEEGFTIAGAVERLRRDPSGALEEEFLGAPLALKEQLLGKDVVPLEVHPPLPAREERTAVAALERIRSLRTELRALADEMRRLTDGEPD